MARLIDADALVAELQKKPIHDGHFIHTRDVSDAIFYAPTISPDEVRGVGEITGDDACPSCGCWIPTDDAHDAIFKNEVKFCYYCGMRLRMKGAEDGTAE